MSLFYGRCLDSGVMLFGFEYWTEHLPSVHGTKQVTLSLIESISPSVKWGQ